MLLLGHSKRRLYERKWIPVRINKYLSLAGVCSRREADRLIAAGKIRINQDLAQMGSQVTENDNVYMDGRLVKVEDERILLAVNKPVGIVCTTTSNQGRNNIVDYLNYPKRIYPIGRLDKDSQGLLLMTNDGELMDKLLRSVNGHEKEYIVDVDKDLDKTFVKRMQAPMYIKELDRTTMPCEVKLLGKRRFSIILKQGLNRQIRRMCEILGVKVLKLERIRIVNIMLNDLPVGATRRITDEEYIELCKAVYVGKEEYGK